MPVRSFTSQDGRDAVLRTELTDLHRQQWNVLEAAAYIGMSAEQAREYEKRARRIVELQRTA